MKTLSWCGLVVACLWALPAAAQAPAPSDAPAAAFAEGRALLDTSRRLTLAARQAILDANRTRQALTTSRGRPGAGTAPPPDPQLVRQLEIQQDNAARWRAEGDSTRQRALQRLTDGLVGRFAGWVGDTRPLTLDDEVQQFFAHNTRLRSVHPNQPEPQPEAAASAAAGDLAQMRPMLAAQQVPGDLDLAAFQLSRNDRYLAHIEVHPDAERGAGNAASVPLNRMHRWRLLISDLDGRPLAGASVGVAGHMPGHVHGLPTQPRVLQELAPGVYLVEGLKFQMSGWWVMQFEIKPRDAAMPPDNVAFNLVF